jgi:hypothetical protein
MWKVVGGILIFVGGFTAGIQGAKYEFEHKDMYSEEIVLKVPKDNSDVNKQMLYMKAALGMLEEYQRQNVNQQR